METMLTCKEVAERYRVSKQKVWGWIKEGRLGALSVGYNTYRIPMSAIEQFDLAAKTQVNAATPAATPATPPPPAPSAADTTDDPELRQMLEDIKRSQRNG